MSIRSQRRNIRRNIRRVIHQEIPRRVERALAMIGIIVGNKALEFTPVEYGALANSQDREVGPYLGGWQVRIVYTQNYAAALHESDDWSPRPPDQKAGPAWNPNAQSDWMNVADAQTRPAQQRAGRRELYL